MASLNKTNFNFSDLVITWFRVVPPSALYTYPGGLYHVRRKIHFKKYFLHAKMSSVWCGGSEFLWFLIWCIVKVFPLERYSREQALVCQASPICFMSYLHWSHTFVYYEEGRKEGNVLFNDALNTLYLRLYGIRYMVKDHSYRREETCCRHIGYRFRLAARVLLYASSHRQDMYYEERPATLFRHMLVESSCPDKVESTIFGRL